MIRKDMTRFESFFGLRYDEEIASLAEVIAPPYDIVDANERARLSARSPYNAIRVELPEPDGAIDRYAHAAKLFDEWEQCGALRRDDVEAIYIYRMSFLDERNHPRSTTGVIGALGIDATGAGSVLPHERTMPKPKGDRLDLLRATKVNVSPIWGLSLAVGLAALLERTTVSQPALQRATDDEGTTHELWMITDQSTIADICGLISTTPIVVADGHHRYETSGYYRSEIRNQNGDQSGDHDLVMALIVELSPDELFVQAIHRLISGLPDDFDLVSALTRHFTVSQGPDEVSTFAQLLVPNGALGLVGRTGNYFLVPTEALNQAADADLDSSRLDFALVDLPPHDLTYQHGSHHCAELVDDGTAQYAILLRPATVAQIAETAHSGRRMPPKTTFFNPKPRTGMVYRPLITT